MEEVILFPNKTRTKFFVALYSLLWLFVLCLLLIRNADLSRAAWPMFCGAAGIILYAMKLHPGIVHLKLTNRGFEYKNYLPARFIEWNNVCHFTTYLHRFRRYVGWNYSRSYSGTRTPFAILMGVEGYMLENFGHKPKDLERLLEEWRKRNTSGP